MPQAHKMGWLGVIIALIGTIGLITGVNANAGGIEDVKNQTKIAADKLEKSVHKALAKAREYERSRNYSGAANLLKTFKGFLEDDSTLAKGKRQQLLTYISSRVKELDGRARIQSKSSGTTSLRDRYNQGRKRPGNSSSPSNIANKVISNRNQELALDSEYKYKFERGVLRLNRDLRKKMIPPRGDFELPTYWAKLSKMRDKFTSRLSEEEAAFLRAMNSTLSVDYNRARLEDVVKHLRNATKQVIFVKPSALQEVGITNGHPITLQGKKLKVRTILKVVTRQAGLAYIFKDGIIQIVTPDEARNTLTTVAYPIGGLVPPPDPRLPPYINYARQQQAIYSVLQLITTTIAPETWAVNGGKATIAYNPVTQTIIIRQSAEMHRDVSKTFGSGSGR